jgi:hypothetical protein
MSNPNIQSSKFKSKQRYLKFAQYFPSPFDGGGAGWGWTKSTGSPLPFIPSHQGRGDFWGISKMLEINSQSSMCKKVKFKIERIV